MLHGQTGSATVVNDHSSCAATPTPAAVLPSALRVAVYLVEYASGSDGLSVAVRVLAL
jgi:hypothetical protein